MADTAQTRAATQQLFTPWNPGFQAPDGDLNTADDRIFQGFDYPDITPGGQVPIVAGFGRSSVNLRKSVSQTEGVTYKTVIPRTGKRGLELA